MSAFTVLAVVIGIIVGVGGCLWWMKSKSKGLIEKAMDILSDNGGKIPSMGSLLNTLESEGGDVHTNPSEKEGEPPKEESLQTPAPSSNIEEVKEVVDKK